MNVLLVVPWDQARGGVATVVNNVAGFLSQQGHGVSFLHPGEPERLKEKTTKAGFRGYELNLRSPLVKERPLRSIIAFLLLFPRTLMGLRRLLSDERIDVVSIHYPVPSFVYFAIARVVRPFRLVVSVHGADIRPGGRSPRRQPWTVRVLMARADAVTAPSQSFLNDLLADFPGVRGRAEFVHNGIDAADLSSLPDSDGFLDEPYVLCIAAHNEKKGIDTLLRSFAQARTLGLTLKLVLVGDGPLRSELERLAQQLELNDRILFAGELHQQEVRRALHGCSVFVLPSRAEPFGIAILEAMTAGKPIIATRVGGIPEFVTHEENGILVPPDDPELLAQALLRVTADPALRERLGTAGRQTVQAAFTSQRMGAQFERLFANATDSPQRRGERRRTKASLA